MTLTTPIWGTVCNRKTNASRANRYTKFDDYIFRHSKKIYGVLNFKMDHVTQATLLSGMISRPGANI